jgi:hypothetical protein
MVKRVLPVLKNAPTPTAHPPTGTGNVYLLRVGAVGPKLPRGQLNTIPFFTVVSHRLRIPDPSRFHQKPIGVASSLFLPNPRGFFTCPRTSSPRSHRLNPDFPAPFKTHRNLSKTHPTRTHRHNANWFWLRDTERC